MSDRFEETLKWANSIRGGSPPGGLPSVGVSNPPKKSGSGMNMWVWILIIVVAFLLLWIALSLFSAKKPISPQMTGMLHALRLNQNPAV